MTRAPQGLRQAVVLVGGEGRRLRPLTDTRPKPMMPLVDRPFVAHQLDHLRRYGVTDVVFSCGYRPDAIEGHFGDGAAVGMRLRYVVDPAPLGTAGAVRNAEALLAPGEPVLVLNGDILTDLDLAALAARHAESGAVGTIALTPVDDPSAYGLVRLDAERRVRGFLEKPRPEDLLPGEPYLINAGTYLLQPEAVAAIPPGIACSIEREIFPALAAGGRLYGFPSDAYWRDIGTPASYLAAHHDVLRGAVRTAAPSGAAFLAPGAELRDGARVDGLTSIGAGALIGAGARLEGSIVGAGAYVGDDVTLRHAVLGEGVVVGAGARLTDGVVVGDRARIAAGHRLEGPVSVPTHGAAP